MVTVEIPAEFGYVIGCVVLSFFVTKWMAFKVGGARKKYEVPYPRMYSDVDDRFNCIQRAHQNTLENYPDFLVLTLISGLYTPKLTAVAALIWIVGRIVYAKGYYTFDPAKRTRGGFMYLGLLAMLISTIAFALKLVDFPSCISTIFDTVKK